MYSFIVPKQLNNWFLTFQNKHNNVSFAMDIETDTDDCNWLDNSNWNVYITTNIDDGKIFRTSPVVKFKEEINEVTTLNGSVYLLNNPLNTNQLIILKKFLNNISSNT